MAAVVDGATSFTPKLGHVDWDAVAAIDVDSFIAGRVDNDPLLDSLYDGLVRAKVSPADEQPAATAETGENRRLVQLFRVTQLVMELQHFYFEEQTRLSQDKDAVIQQLQVVASGVDGGSDILNELREMQSEIGSLEERNQTAVRNLQQQEKLLEAEKLRTAELGRVVEEGKLREQDLAHELEKAQRELADLHRLQSQTTAAPPPPNTTLGRISAALSLSRPSSAAKGDVADQIIAEKNVELGKCLDALQAANEKNESLAREVDLLVDQLQKAGNEIQLMTEEQIKSRQALLNSDKLVDELKEQNIQLQARLVDLNEKVNGYDGLQDNVMDELQDQLGDWRETIANLQHIVEEKEREIQWLQEEQKNLQNQLKLNDSHEVTKLLNLQNERIEKLEQQLQQSAKDFEQLSAEYAAFAGKSKSTIAKVDSHAIDEQLRETERQIAAREDEVLQLKIKLQQYESGVFGLTEAVSQIEEYRRQMDLRDADVLKLTHELNEAQRQADDLLDQNTELRGQLGLNLADLVDTGSVQLRREAELTRLKTICDQHSARIRQLEEERVQLKKLLTLKPSFAVPPTDRIVRSDEKLGMVKEAISDKKELEVAEAPVQESSKTVAKLQTIETDRIAQALRQVEQDCTAMVELIAAMCEAVEIDESKQMQQIAGKIHSPQLRSQVLAIVDSFRGKMDTLSTKLCDMERENALRETAGVHIQNDHSNCISQETVDTLKQHHEVELNSLKQQLDEITKHADSINRVLDGLARDTADEQKRHCIDIHRRNIVLSVNEKKLARQLDVLQASDKSARLALSQARQEISTVRSEADTNVAALKLRLDEKATAIEHLHRQLAETVPAGQLTDAQARLEVASQQYRRLVTINEKLSDSTATCEKTLAENKQLRDQAEILRRQLQDTKLNAQSPTNDDATTPLSKLQILYANAQFAATIADEKIRSLTANEKEMEAQIQRLNDQVLTLRDELSRLERSETELMAQLETARMRDAAYEMPVEEVKLLIHSKESLQHQVTQLQLSLHAATEQIADITVLKAKAEQRAGQLRHQLVAVQSPQSDSKALIVKLNEQLARALDGEVDRHREIARQTRVIRRLHSLVREVWLAVEQRDKLLFASRCRHRESVRWWQLAFHRLRQQYVGAEPLSSVVRDNEQLGRLQSRIVELQELNSTLKQEHNEAVERLDRRQITEEMALTPVEQWMKDAVGVRVQVSGLRRQLADAHGKIEYLEKLNKNEDEQSRGREAISIAERVDWDRCQLEYQKREFELESRLVELEQERSQHMTEFSSLMRAFSLSSSSAVATVDDNLCGDPSLLISDQLKDLIKRLADKTAQCAKQESEGRQLADALAKAKQDLNSAFRQLEQMSTDLDRERNRAGMATVQQTGAVDSRTETLRMQASMSMGEEITAFLRQQLEQKEAQITKYRAMIRKSTTLND